MHLASADIALLTRYYESVSPAAAAALRSLITDVSGRPLPIGLCNRLQQLQRAPSGSSAQCSGSRGDVEVCAMLTWLYQAWKMALNDESVRLPLLAVLAPHCYVGSVLHVPNGKFAKPHTVGADGQKDTSIEKLSKKQSLTVGETIALWINTELGKTGKAEMAALGYQVHCGSYVHWMSVVAIRAKAGWQLEVFDPGWLGHEAGEVWGLGQSLTNLINGATIAAGEGGSVHVFGGAQTDRTDTFCQTWSAWYIVQRARNVAPQAVVKTAADGLGTIAAFISDVITPKKNDPKIIFDLRYTIDSQPTVIQATPKNIKTAFGLKAVSTWKDPGSTPQLAQVMMAAGAAHHGAAAMKEDKDDEAMDVQMCE